jgi:HEAT repeat protein
MSNNQDSESSRVYYLFYTFFLIPLMICVFGVLFVLITKVLTQEPTDINQLLSKLETGSMRDKADASYRINKLFTDYSDKYDPSYRNRIIRIHNMSKSEFNIDNTLRLHVIMIMGNSKDSTFGKNLIGELSAKDESFRIKAIESLGKLQYSPAADLVKNFLKVDNSFLEKLAAAGALGNMKNPSIINDLVELINSWPANWNESDGPELRWEATIALLKLGYSDSSTIQIITNLLDKSYYGQYQQLDQNKIDFILLKIVNILYSIDNIELLKPFEVNIYKLSEDNSNLELQNLAKKLHSRLK